MDIMLLTQAKDAAERSASMMWFLASELLDAGHRPEHVAAMLDVSVATMYRRLKDCVPDRAEVDGRTRRFAR